MSQSNAPTPRKRAGEYSTNKHTLRELERRANWSEERREYENCKRAFNTFKDRRLKDARESESYKSASPALQTEIEASVIELATKLRMQQGKHHHLTSYFKSGQATEASKDLNIRTSTNTNAFNISNNVEITESDEVDIEEWPASEKEKLEVCIAIAFCRKNAASSNKVEVLDASHELNIEEIDRRVSWWIDVRAALWDANDSLWKKLDAFEKYPKRQRGRRLEWQTNSWKWLNEITKDTAGEIVEDHNMPNRHANARDIFTPVELMIVRNLALWHPDIKDTRPGPDDIWVHHLEEKLQLRFRIIDDEVRDPVTIQDFRNARESKIERETYRQVAEMAWRVMIWRDEKLNIDEYPTYQNQLVFGGAEMACMHPKKRKWDKKLANSGILWMNPEGVPGNSLWSMIPQAKFEAGLRKWAVRHCGRLSGGQVW